MMIPIGARHRARDRRPVVRRALSALRLDLHHVVLRRREHRALHRGRRRRDAPRTARSICRSCSATRSRGRSACSVRPACGSRTGAPRDRTVTPRLRPMRARFASGRCCGSGSSASSASSRFRRRSRILHLPDRSRGRRARRALHRARGPDRRPSAAAIASADRRGRSVCCSPSPALGRCTSFKTVGQGLRARRRGVRRRGGGGRRALALVLALRQPRARGAGRRRALAGHAELGIRDPRAAELRALQAGAAAERRDPRARSPTATSSRTTTSRCRAWCITSGGTSRSSSIAEVPDCCAGDSGCSRCCRRRLRRTAAGNAGVPTCVLDRRPTVNIKLKAVLARDPLPEVLLITNRCDR